MTRAASVRAVPEPVVSVVVPARDAAATLPALLAALSAQAQTGFEVLLVDDGSTDATAAIARAHPGVRLLQGEGRGPGAARNLGLEHAKAPVVAFTDADCVPAPGWLASGLAALERADLVQGRVEPAGPCGPWDRTVTVPRLSTLFETANLFARTDAVLAAGGFEPWLRPRGGKELGEDVWLGWRLQRAGARVAFAPDALVRHAVFPRSPAAFVRERARLRFFPAMVRRIPELRGALLWRGLFLNRRQATFDLALVGLVAARRRHLLLLLAAPYARELWRSARGAGKRGAPRVAAVHLAADAVGTAALLFGSVRERTPVG